jgi:hypothetical protein
MTAAVAVRQAGGSVARLGADSIRVLPWGVWVVLAVSVMTSAAFWAIDGFPRLPLSFAAGPVNLVSTGLIALTTGTVGALLAWRHPRNPIGWLLLVEGLFTGFLTPVNLLVAHGVGALGPWPGTTILAAWLTSTLMLPVAATTCLLVLFLFPNGRFAGRRWRIGGLVLFVGTGLLAVSSALNPVGMLWYPAVPNPTAVPAAYEGAVFGLRVAGVAATVVAVLIAVGSVTARYRYGDPRLRLQLRWIVVGVAIMAATFAPFLVSSYALGVSDTLSDVLLGVLAVGDCVFPLTVAVAMIRQHLYDIDGVIWRTLAYVPLMGLLAGLYAASVAFFQRLFISLTGNSSDGAIVISSLMLAAIFGPTRSAIEGRVARRLKPAPRSEVRPDQGEPMASPAGPPIRSTAAEGASDARQTDGPDSLAERVALLERTIAEWDARRRADAPADLPETPRRSRGRHRSVMEAGRQAP